jgi:hypothetical protein
MYRFFSIEYAVLAERAKRFRFFRPHADLAAAFRTGGHEVNHDGLSLGRMFTRSLF